MSADVITGLLGIAGVAGTLFGTLATSRGQQRTAAEQIKANAGAEEAKARAVVYVDFMRIHMEFEAAWRRLLGLQARDGKSADPAEVRRLYAIVYDLHERRWSALAVLLLNVPEGLANLAQDVTNAYTQLDEIGEGRLSFSNGAPGRQQQFDDQADACWKLLWQFAAETQAPHPSQVPARTPKTF